MKRHISYPKIKQFRQVISDINHSASFLHLDENNDPVYDSNYEKPVVTFRGTVKLHGTNAGVSYNSIEGMWAQSRKNIITPEKDNAGFAFFVESNKEVINEMFQTLIKDNGTDTDNYTLTIYGEWCGGNIQKGVAISGLDKMWVIFGVKVSPNDQGTDEQAYWIDHSKLKSIENKIYNVVDFKTFEIDIDFGNPSEAQNKIVDLVLEVEKECPVGREFGRKIVPASMRVGENVCTTGEGIVFTGKFKDNYYRFKAKGKEHSASKVKTVAPIDVEKMNSIKEFVDYAVTENRLNQGVEQVFTTSSTPVEIKMMGAFLKWVSNDVITEEMDVMKESNLEPRDVKKEISNKARKWFMDYLDKLAGL